MNSVAANLSWLRPARRFALALIALLGCRASGDIAPDLNHPATVGVMRLGFAHVSENDAKAAILALTHELTDRLGYQVGNRVEIFDDPLRLREACRSGRIQLLLTGTWDYLTMDVSDQIQDTFVVETDGATQHTWHLVVRADRDFRSLADLRGRHVLVVHNGMAHLGQPWIETRCLEHNLGEPAQHFGVVELIAKPSGALLPVFFGKADACVIDEVSFRLLAQLNPQIQKQLRIIESSPPFSNALVCLSRYGWRSPQIRSDIAQRLTSIQTEPAGRQMLTLFKCDRILPCPPPQLDTIVKLFQLNRKLRHAGGSP